MKQTWLLWLVPALCGAILPANAQTNDWQAIQRLDPGSSLSISAVNRPKTRECELLKVTGTELVCNLERRAFATQRSFQRSEIIEIRLEFPDQHRMILGAILGGAAGGAIGGLIWSRSADPETRRAAPGVGALFGGSFGAAIGRAIHQHGPVLYQRK